MSDYELIEAMKAAFENVAGDRNGTWDAAMRAVLAAERARADAAVAEAAEHKMFRDESARRLAQCRADRDRLRAAIEQAPHEGFCLGSKFRMADGTRADLCNCWKRAALGKTNE